MNTPRLLGQTQISIVFTTLIEIMCFSNLVVILPNSQLHLVPTTSALGSPLKAQYIQEDTIARQPTYTRQQLLDIKNIVKLDNRYSRIPFETINLVRKFKINKHPSKLEGEHPTIKQQKSNPIT